MRWRFRGWALLSPSPDGTTALLLAAARHPDAVAMNLDRMIDFVETGFVSDKGDQFNDPELADAQQLLELGAKIARSVYSRARPPAPPAPRRTLPV